MDPDPRIYAETVHVRLHWNENSGSLGQATGQYSLYTLITPFQVELQRDEERNGEEVEQPGPGQGARDHQFTGKK